MSGRPKIIVAVVFGIFVLAVSGGITAEQMGIHWTQSVLGWFEKDGETVDEQPQAKRVITLYVNGANNTVFFNSGECAEDELRIEGSDQEVPVNIPPDAVIVVKGDTTSSQFHAYKDLRERIIDQLSQTGNKWYLYDRPGE